jgi:hypothetical protein
MAAERVPVGWGAWVGWVAASSIGLMIGLVVYLPVAVILGDELEPIARTATSGAAGAALGVSIGVAQWTLLRRRGAPEQARWVLASVVGGAVGGTGALVVADLMSAAVGTDFVTNLVFGGAFLGASLGVAQWLLLRRRFARAGWWIVASTVGLSLGLGLGRVGWAALYDAVGVALGQSLAGVVATVIFGTLAVAGYGAITGGALFAALIPGAGVTGGSR